MAVVSLPGLECSKNVAVGTYTLTAVATDSNGLTTTSAPVITIVDPAQAGGTSTMYFITTDHLPTGGSLATLTHAADWRMVKGGIWVGARAADDQQARRFLRCQNILGAAISGQG